MTTEELHQQLMTPTRGMSFGDAYAAMMRHAAKVEQERDEARYEAERVRQEGIPNVGRIVFPWE